MLNRSEIPMYHEDKPEKHKKPQLTVSSIQRREKIDELTSLLPSVLLVKSLQHDVKHLSTRPE
jgi:hypothetical protein